MQIGHDPAVKLNLHDTDQCPHAMPQVIPSVFGPLIGTVLVLPTRVEQFTATQAALPQGER